MSVQQLAAGLMMQASSWHSCSSVCTGRAPQAVLPRAPQECNGSISDSVAPTSSAKDDHALLLLTCLGALQVMPVLFGIMRSTDNELREFLFQQMCELVAALRQHMRKYLPDILQLCSECWRPASPLMPHILKLLSELSGRPAPTAVAAWH